MKNLRHFILLFSCFLAGCVYHELEESYGPTIKGKVDDGVPKTFQEEVEYKISKDIFFYLGEGSLPVEDIWKNINYKSFDYKNFFKKFCPASGQTVSPAKFVCNFSAPNMARKFSIAVGQNKITVDIQNISVATSKKNASIRAIWEITGKDGDFAVTKYEKIIISSFSYYKRVDVSYKSAFGAQKIAASGEMSVAVYGAYDFYTDNLQFALCDNVPSGQIFLNSLNGAEIFFYDYNPACKPCVPAIIDDYYGKYSYCGPWALQDLFDYLEPFITN